MRKLLIVLFVLLMVLTLATPALAHDGDPHDHLCQDVNGDGKVNGHDFAQHVVQHAQAGMLGADHNPGMHRGFSVCVTAGP